MGLMNDIFLPGLDWSAQSGHITAANHEDSYTRMRLAASSQICDQTSIETYQDGTVTDDDGNGIYRLRVMDGGITNAMLAGSIATSKLVGGGIVDPADAYSFRAYGSSATSVASNTWVSVGFQTESWDDAGVFAVANGKYTPGATGYYHLSARVEVVAGAASGDRGISIAIYKNGSLYAMGQFSDWGYEDVSSTQVRWVAVISTDVEVDDVADYFQIYVKHSNGSTLNTKQGSAYTYFTGRKITA